MKKVVMLMALLAATGAGLLLGQWWSAANDNSDATATNEREILYWKAPMDPSYRRDFPGTSPMGMDLVPVYADQAGQSEPGIVAINPAVVSNLGIRTAIAERSALSRRIETVGYVGYDENSFQQINTRVDGWIEKLAIKTAGDPVTKGQVLFELYSPALVNAQQEYLTTLNSSSAALRQASRQRLHALGISEADIKRLENSRSVRQRVRIYAESDGLVTHLSVRDGMHVTPATAVMAIANLDRVWVQAEVFERQAAWVQIGQQASIELDYLPGQQWQGSVDYIYPELDAKTRTLKVRLSLDNEKQLLRPNMFARVVLFADPTSAVVHIPREALIRGGSINRVVLRVEEGRFRSVPVEVGIEAGNRVEIRSGVAVGDRVVTSGQFLIDSESNIASALARIDENAGDEMPMRVSVAAVVKGWRIAEQRVTLRHDAIAQWSWPVMTMGFDVSDAAMLTGLSLDQPVTVVIEKQANGNYIVSDIQPDETMDRSGNRETLP